MPYKYRKRTREFLGAFLFPFQSSFPPISGVFNIPLALVGYEMIIAIYLRIGSCLACVYRVMDARGKFGEHERSFLSALQTSQVHP